MAEGHVAWSALLTRRNLPALLLVGLGVWLHAADSLIVATMMPAIVGEIGGAALVAWSVALYEVGSIAAGAASGFLALRFGLRRPMAGAAGLFAAGCAVSALAPTMPALLSGRLLQGLGGGGLMALSFVAVGVLFPRRLMARVLGCVAALWGASSFLGPLVGGGFVEYATWRWGFGAFALQAVLLGAWIGATRALGARPDPDGASGALPVARIAVLSAGVVLVAYAGLEVGAVATPALIAAGAACLAVFVQLDRRAGTGRLLPARAFDPATVPGSALAMILLYAAGTIALTAYGPVLAVMIHGVSALVAGALVACSAVGWTLAAVLVSGAAPRHDPGFIAGGFSLVLISVLLLAWSMPVGPVWLIALSAVLEGGGFGMAWSFVLRRATAGAPAGEIARISGAVPTVQRLGYALGAGYLGLVANAAGFATAETAGQAAHAARWIFLACLPLALLGFAAMLRFLQLGARGEPAEPASGTGSGIG